MSWQNLSEDIAELFEDQVYEFDKIPDRRRTQTRRDVNAGLHSLERRAKVALADWRIVQRRKQNAEYMRRRYYEFKASDPVGWALWCKCQTKRKLERIKADPARFASYRLILKQRAKGRLARVRANPQRDADRKLKRRECNRRRRAQRRLYAQQRWESVKRDPIQLAAYRLKQREYDRRRRQRKGMRAAERMAA